MTQQPVRPRAIAMWDFSWLERRWPGAGYEDWDVALDELAERGYDAVRIDAYPHLVSADPDKRWTVISCGQEGDWGSPSEVDVHVLETLLEFLGKCRDRNIVVGLSTWFKRDPDDVRMRIKTPEDHAKLWLDTLEHVERACLMDTILYVDLCNEWPQTAWAPFLYEAGESKPADLASPRIVDWMRRSTATLRTRFPELDYTFSTAEQFSTWDQQDTGMLDLLEPHIWMAHPDLTDFCEAIGYVGPDADFQAIVRKGQTHYLENKARYDASLVEWVDKAADWSRRNGLPLVTTECWSLINFRDWPMIDWGWIKDICELGVHASARTGRWTAIGTSNFCGPQYVGMWRDVAWHRRLTDAIKSAPLDAELKR